MYKETPSHTEITDKNQHFTQLVKDLSERVYWTVRKMVLVHEDANDVTQDVFIKVWKNLDSFKGESKIYTWVHRIAVNECFNFLEKKKRRISPTDWNELMMQDLASDPYFNGNEEVKKLHSALLELPEKQRLVFNMKYFEDKKYSQIAEITGTSEGALKASYHIAVKKIKEILKDG